MTEPSPLIEKAKAFAIAAHEGQVRSSSQRITLEEHVTEVAELVATAGGSEEEVAAAWLHDTVEDTTTTIEDIRREFGEQIAAMVDGLTDPPEFTKLTLKERKAAQAERVAHESGSVQRIKLADQTANVRVVGLFVFELGVPDGRFIYLEGARRIADACKNASPLLYEKFLARYNEGLKNLST